MTRWITAICGAFWTSGSATACCVHAGQGARGVTVCNTFGAHDDFYVNLRHNVINMRGAQHVILDGLEITGGNWGLRIGSKTNGQNAVPERPMGDILRPARYITVRNCHIHHTHNTAVSANFPGDVYEGLVFQGNDIHHAGRYGESFYFGNYSAGGETWAIAKHCVVEENHLHDNVWVGSWYPTPPRPRVSTSWPSTTRSTSVAHLKPRDAAWSWPR